MFEIFTNEGINVIMLAQEEARRLGHNFVGTEQILLGLIRKETGIAAKVLRNLGLSLDGLRSQVESIIGRGNGKCDPEIPFTPRAKRVLELSLKESARLGHDYVGTEHLLLGTLREGGGVAVRVLENCRVDMNMAKALTIRAITVSNVTADSQVTTKRIIIPNQSTGSSVPLKVFLAHANEDKKLVFELHSQLIKQGYKPWLDKIDLVPGQNWRTHIPKVIRESDVFIACFSKESIRKSSFVQKELRLALNHLAQKPSDTIYLIPVKLDDCEIPDLRHEEYGINIRDIHWVDYWQADGFRALVRALELVRKHKD